LNLETRKLAQADLYFDSGGYSRVNLYRISDSAFLIRDCFESFVVDTARQTIERDDTRRKEGAFVGSFDVDSSGAWRFISARERAELPTELKGG